MTSVEFCYWLQGVFEVTDVKSLDEKQTQIVKDHLNLVFYHEIDNKYADKAKAQVIHNGGVIDTVAIEKVRRKLEQDSEKERRQSRGSGWDTDAPLMC